MDQGSQSLTCIYRVGEYAFGSRQKRNRLEALWSHDPVTGSQEVHIQIHQPRSAIRGRAQQVSSSNNKFVVALAHICEHRAR